MVGQRLNVMRSDEPLLLVLVRQSILDVLEIVVRWQVELVARRNVVVNELGAVRDHTEALVWIILLATLDVNKVLLDVVLLRLQLLFLFKVFLKLLIFAFDARLRFSQLSKRNLLAKVFIVFYELVILTILLIFRQKRI